MEKGEKRGKERYKGGRYRLRRWSPPIKIFPKSQSLHGVVTFYAFDIARK